VVSLDVRTGAVRRLRSSLERDLRRGCISVPQAIEFPTGDGETAHALLYPPANDAFAAPPGELPPAIVISHGGPTGQASTALDLRVQLWTSRGFAVVDVDYRGSTGYGRAYRERLRGEWGIADVEDCVNAARHLGDVVDLDRLIIRGASAGGYTTLCALTFHDVFRAGASWFGVADLEALTSDTHKFESHYLDGLVGPYPEAADRYRARSPIHAVERLRRPMILFQGLLDDVVPPAQAELMVRSLEAAGIPYAYMPFENEHHGFRRAENVQRALEAELSFYAQVFGFELGEQLAPVSIVGL
jgi:dipeptidyl aminopeptidase/acylaminoacyl peptidase